MTTSEADSGIPAPPSAEETANSDQLLEKIVQEHLTRAPVAEISAPFRTGPAVTKAGEAAAEEPAAEGRSDATLETAIAALLGTAPPAPMPEAENATVKLNEMPSESLGAEVAHGAPPPAAKTQAEESPAAAANPAAAAGTSPEAEDADEGLSGAEMDSLLSQTSERDAAAADPQPRASTPFEPTESQVAEGVRIKGGFVPKAAAGGRVVHDEAGGAEVAPEVAPAKAATAAVETAAAVATPAVTPAVAAAAPTPATQPVPEAKPESTTVAAAKAAPAATAAATMAKSAQATAAAAKSPATKAIPAAAAAATAAAAPASAAPVAPATKTTQAVTGQEAAALAAGDLPAAAALPAKKGRFVHDLALLVLQLMDMPFGWLSSASKHYVAIAGGIFACTGMVLLIFAYWHR